MGANLLIFVLCFYFFLLFFCNKRLGLYSLSYGPLLYLAVSRELIASVVTVFNPFPQKQLRNIWSPCFCKSYWQASVIVKFGKRLFTRIDYKYCIIFPVKRMAYSFSPVTSYSATFCWLGGCNCRVWKWSSTWSSAAAVCCFCLAHSYVHGTFTCSYLLHLQQAWEEPMEVCTAFSYSWGDWAQVQHFT